MQMTIVSLIGILLGFASIPVFMRGTSFNRVGTSVAIAILHVFASQVYFVFTQSNTADAYSYYYASNYWSQYPWTGLSTVLIGHVTQSLKNGLGASYFDCFMVFQALGTWGLVILLRAFDEIHIKTRIQARLPLFLLFLPGAQFWTSAIGKDAPMFFAISLGVWSALKLSTRSMSFGLALFLMGIIRPHIALVTALSIASASVLHSSVSASRKFFLIIGSVVVVGVLVSTIQTRFGVDLTDTASVSDFWEGRAAVEAGDTGSTSIGGASFPIRLLSLLFRPLFFDASSGFALVASFENLGSLVLFGYLLKHFRDIRYLMKRVIFVQFVLLMTFGLIVLLALLTYNVGLGFRERTMILPPLFCLYVAIDAFLKTKNLQALGSRAAAPAASSMQGQQRTA